MFFIVSKIHAASDLESRLDSGGLCEEAWRLLLAGSLVGEEAKTVIDLVLLTMAC